MRTRSRIQDSGVRFRAGALRLVRVFAWALLLGSAAVSADEKPRVVSLAPHLTELAFAAGAGDTLVGVVAYSDWPEAARKLPRIGDAFRFDLETILGLDADLALAWRGGTPKAVADRLKELGIEILWIETSTLSDIAAALEQIGTRLGTPEHGREAAEAYRQDLASLRASGPDEVDVTVFYQVSARPLFTLGGRHVITEVFESCGARNVFADLDTEATAIDREAVITRSPELIIAGINEPADDPLSVWRDTRMVEDGHTRLEAVDPERLVRPTPRIVEGIEHVCELVRDVTTASHGDADE
ncbi:cobalamin-binding protein [Wenzhouxiangella sp. 15181]|uniref:cobalamin-binding protein n=1 Tax=Wenzhouxiangella sp. 15181 TaxID=2301224 RepID=UPI000E3279F7|nr:cobalamin-binding protein [Wenzhouxiangella sp. 15181]RFF27907.1 cobalamin-binding protein [Wenzhouxiangella sp. 15181]RFP67218.1 cobalamin-binding protein [Wenzhouxiangella sp. 15190]